MVLAEMGWTQMSNTTLLRPVYASYEAMTHEAAECRRFAARHGLVDGRLAWLKRAAAAEANAIGFASRWEG